MRTLLGSIAIAAIASATVAVMSMALAGPSAKGAHLTVVSPDLRQGFSEQNLLNAFGCTGSNVSPALKWSGAPSGTKSFVVTLYDPDDHDNPSGWWHWVAYDIPAGVSQLAGGAGKEHSAQLPAGTLQGRSDLGTLAYHGPCPDKGDAPHRYTFTVYALDVAKLPVDPGASGAMVVETAHDHILGKGQLIVRFGR